MFVSGGAIALFQRVILLISGEAAALEKNIKKMENALFVPRFQEFSFPYALIGFQRWVLFDERKQNAGRTTTLFIVRTFA